MFYTDKSLPGFGVAVSTKTGLKTFFVQPLGGHRITLGKVSENYTLKQARADAEEKIREARRGIDPRPRHRRKSAEGDQPTTLRGWLDKYLARDELAERSRSSYRDSVERHLKDWLDVELGDITGPMVQERHGEIGRDVGRAAANSVMRSFRVVYYYARDHDKTLQVKENPILLLKRHWFKLAPRKRRVTGDELPAFYRAVAALQNQVQRDYLLFVLFTGIRRRQAAALTWDYVDFTARVIRFPGNVTKNKSDFDFPMTDFVQSLLLARSKLRDPVWVFPANSKSGHISEPKYPFKLIKDSIGIHRSVHDLRRTYANALHATKMTVYELKALMHHSPRRDVTGDYLQVEELREPAQEACNLLRRWCGIGAEPATQSSSAYSATSEGRAGQDIVDSL